ncbi:bifunctional phosphoribosylaminoimidazolecarboxamide formyltransferase/IMP cyclohydrolase [Alkalibacter mobilis]|uniref:bifunctional phosphoribosylaminoimidazolecarboxamide formyltransferase/IMP cyclohydrolase n=1 Tax=Alkalibacter mobilis TaxID=2787712 RepID=UPI0018A0E7EA|nr:bifunctional phosphoribosylaminoimidazolecarboxamide formyltransferase/IMP cyclohydrolase [Alkalibacter mobilis]MBF7096923.1 bifunctional phosphoribosylaminoimidazolecarboxamide formyltransferase/IMP cyclohydrolase [Alkalibacter mobilis]
MRALLSVSDKSGILEFAKSLDKLGVEIISTGGTAKLLKDNGIKVMGVSDVTGFPECLDGRVKTLHPKIHGGILAVRDNPEHMARLDELDIKTIDLVVVNLYPFKETISKDDVTLADAIENIDIGGPTMIRAAAKNHGDVAVITDPKDYPEIIRQLEENKSISKDTKYALALKVFEHTASYDAMIADYLKKQIETEPFGKTMTLTFEKVQDMRYGENPHQKAAFYKEIGSEKGTLVEAQQLHGKELSYNNINDTDSAIQILKEFHNEPTVVAVKHANPCGVGSGTHIYEAFKKAYEGDPVSIFGGIIAANKEIDEQTASKISELFIEVLVAPGYSQEALAILKAKKNIRILKLENIAHKYHGYELKKVMGGVLIQDVNHVLLGDDLKVVTKRQPTAKEMEDLMFAWKIVKHTKSNAITFAKDKMLVANGPGQVSRIAALNNAARQGGEALIGSVLASDAFFPFPDSVMAAYEAGITAIIQPGGAMKDEESIELCNRYNIAMVFTGIRHFKH